MFCHKYSYFVCIIPERNKKAFYAILAGKDLFGYILIRKWGRIGTRGQPGKRQRFLEKTGMLKEYERVHKERIKHGYIQLENSVHVAIKKEAPYPVLLTRNEKRLPKLVPELYFS